MYLKKKSKKGEFNLLIKRCISIFEWSKSTVILNTRIIAYGIINAKRFFRKFVTSMLKNLFTRFGKPFEG